MTLQTADAAYYANIVLKSLDIDSRISEMSDHPAIAWKRSGLLGVTGFMLPIPLISHVDGALMALKALTANNQNLPTKGSLLVGERSRLLSLKTRERETAGGMGQLLDTVDGQIALNLPREGDWDLVPAWLEAPAQSWNDISNLVRNKASSFLVKRGAELGLAISESKLSELPSKWFMQNQFKRKDRKSIMGEEAPLVVDLSALWAGPLASHLLSLSGARVVKVESPNRPDGMRRGHQGFYSLLNTSKDCVALDFQNPKDLASLKDLLDKADIVIEASRPRAFPQIGIVAEDFVAAKPGKIWARLRAYDVDDNRIGFGDDIGVAAGLTTLIQEAYGETGFVGDAIADPISGLHLALLIQAKFNQGGGVVLDLSMRDILRYAMGDIPKDLKQNAKEWSTIAMNCEGPLYRLRQIEGQVKGVGADNNKWLA